MVVLKISYGNWRECQIVCFSCFWQFNIIFWLLLWWALHVWLALWNIADCFFVAIERCTVNCPTSKVFLSLPCGSNKVINSSSTRDRNSTAVESHILLLSISCSLNQKLWERILQNVLNGDVIAQILQSVGICFVESACLVVCVDHTSIKFGMMHDF